MNDFPWEEYSGDWITFAEIGDSVVGTLKDIHRGKDFNGNPCPELVIDTAEGTKTVTAGQVRLKLALADARPQVSDKIAIVFIGYAPASGGQNPAKLFEVKVQKSDAPFTTGGVSADDLLAG